MNSDVSYCLVMYKETDVFAHILNILKFTASFAVPKGLKKATNGALIFTNDSI